MTTKITNIVNELSTLSLLEALELVKLMEKTFGIDTSILTSTTNTTNIELSQKEVIAEKKIEEKTTFDLILTEILAEKKIAILKIVRQITGLGLKESKEVIENIPKVLKEGISKEECEKLAKELEAAGAKVNIK